MKKALSLQSDNVIVIGKMKMSYPWLDMGWCQRMALRPFYEAIFSDYPFSGLFSVNIDLLRDPLGGPNGAEKISYEPERTSEIPCRQQDD
jgi:hypothetical protein